MKMIKYIIMTAVLLGLLGLTNPAMAAQAPSLLEELMMGIYSTFGLNNGLPICEPVMWDIFHTWYPFYPSPY